jgi:uncharacterized membrane protein (TIGR02234 family)
VNPRRELRLAVLLCLLGSGLILFAVSRTWVTFVFPSTITITGLSQGVGGGKIVDGARAFGYVGLAGVLAVAATRRWGRVLVGAVLAVAGAGVVVVVGHALAGGLAVRALPFDSVAGSCGAGVTDAACLRAAAAFAGFRVFESHLWAWATIVGGILLAASGGLVAVRGRRWAALSAAYEAPAALPPVTDKGVWDAFDRGDDPTT